MSTYTDDQLALPHFEDRLWDELAELHAHSTGGAGTPASGRPGGPADHPDGRRRLMARHRRRVLAVAAAVVAVGAAVGGAVLLGGDSRPSTSIAPAEQPESQPDPSTTTVSAEPEAEGAVAGTPTPTVTGECWVTAQVSTDDGCQPDRSAEAVVPPSERPDAVVVMEQRDVSGRVTRTWTDEASGSYRSLQLDQDGTPAYESAWLSIEEGGPYEGPAVADPPDTGATIAQRTIDHCFREYQDSSWRPPLDGDQGLPDNWRVDRWVLNELANGTLVADGTEVVDGRELLRYDHPSYEGVVWLEPDTYAPVKVHSYVGSDAEYTQAYTYLPRTAENVALVELPVPAGFTKVDALHGDGERLDAGCE
jgi:hypothetical protein